MKKIKATEITQNAISLIGAQWMLVTAGTPDGYNTMTANWGGIGFLWNKPVAYIFIRPNRHTHQYIERQEHLTLSFMCETYRQALKICGTQSGRDIDKMKEAGLSPWITEDGNIAIADADLVIECRKLYSDMIRPENFIDNTPIDTWYGEDDPMHQLYIVEITDAWARN